MSATAIRELHDLGLTWNQIAGLLGCTRNAAHYLSTGHITMPGPLRRAQRAQVALVAANPATATADRLAWCFSPDSDGSSPYSRLQKSPGDQNSSLKMSEAARDPDPAS